jgi:hypothetical protein
MRQTTLNPQSINHVTAADENIKRVQGGNVFGKASRSRVEDILAIFRNRYLTESSVTARLPQKVRRTLQDLFLASQLPEVAAGVQFCQREDLTCPPPIGLRQVKPNRKASGDGDHR